MSRYNPALVAGIVSIACVVAALLQLLVGLDAGGAPPETVLFSVLALIFAALWRTLR